MASRDLAGVRSETGDCAGGGSPAQVAVRARVDAPANGLLKAAEGKNDTGARAPLAPSIYGALDLGTNNCRLLVAKPSRRGFRVIDAFSRIIRLGEGVLASGRLSEPAIARALEALAVCRDKMRNREVTRARQIATEACRGDENGTKFLARVTAENGIDFVEVATTT